jgi:hypothetical protein
MGTIQHHAIIVTTHDEPLVNAAHAKAAGLGMRVSAVVDSPVNRFFSFAVFPDGSKEGWSESDAGDAQRDGFVAWMLAQAHDDGFSPIDFVEISYGEWGTRCRSNCTDLPGWREGLAAHDFADEEGLVAALDSRRASLAERNASLERMAAELRDESNAYRAQLAALHNLIANHDDAVPADFAVRLAELLAKGTTTPPG